MVGQLGARATEELLTAWFAAEDRHITAWLAREISFQEQRRRRLREFLPLLDQPVGGDDGLDAVFAGYLNGYETAWRAFDDVEEALQGLSDLRLRVAVLTNGATAQRHAKIAAVGLEGRLGPVLTAEDLGASKPDPSTYLTTCRHLDLPASAVMHVGDLHDLDVLAPRAASLRAVHLDRSGCGPADETERITSLRDLTDYLSVL